MGRPERPIDPTDGPLEAFAHELRGLREAAGRPTYSAMARSTHRSSSVLAEAAGGRSLPTLDTTLAYVGECGGDAQEWITRWHATRAALDGGETPDTIPEAAGPAVPELTAPVEADAAALLVPTGRVPAWRTRALWAGAAVVVMAATALIVTHRPDDAAATSNAPTSGTSASPSVTPSPTETLTIEQPATGGRVALLDDVVIRRTGETLGAHIWILVRFAGGPVINPQGDCGTTDGVIYRCAKAQFGDPDTPAGTTFVIEAVSVDEEGHLALQTMVNSGFNAALKPVPYLAESASVTALRR